MAYYERPPERPFHLVEDSLTVVHEVDAQREPDVTKPSSGFWDALTLETSDTLVYEEGPPWENSWSSINTSATSNDLITLKESTAIESSTFESLSSFDDVYALSSSVPLGEGGFGVVYRCVPKKPGRSSHKKTRAVKIVPVEAYNRREIDTLRCLKDCPFIVHFQDIFYGFDRVYIVMDEMRGGDLLTRLGDKACYTENETRIVVRTLLKTVQFLHSRGIAHRDIKLENVLLSSPLDDTSVRLADFGLAKRFRDDNGYYYCMEDGLVTMCGSPHYGAPEVYRLRHYQSTNPYDERCDIWSVGVIAFALMAGYLPFMDSVEDQEDTEQIIQSRSHQENLIFHHELWGEASAAAKEFISSLLQVNPALRTTLDEALESPWMEETLQCNWLRMS